MSLTYIGEQLTLYIGIVFLVAGLFGNGMNVWIFSSVRTYRTTPSSFYYLCGSIVNILFISINLITRIVTSANGFDLTQTSLAWCRARTFFAASLPPMSLGCSCLATIDQFFVTSQNVSIRQLSSIKRTHRLLLLIVIVWCIHGTFGPIFYNITSLRCASPNSVYAIYSVIYVIVIVCAIPLLIISLFGCLTYRNFLRTVILAEEHADRQWTQMILIQVILIVVSMTPYGVNSAYRLITSGIKKDGDRQMKEAFATTVVTLLSYVYYIGSFYMFMISSSRFRQLVRRKLTRCPQTHPNPAI